MEETLLSDVLESLQSQYWGAIHREIAHCILAYQEMERLQSPTSELNIQSPDTFGARFRSFCDIWRMIITSSPTFLSGNEMLTYVPKALILVLSSLLIMKNFTNGHAKWLWIAILTSRDQISVLDLSSKAWVSGLVEAVLLCSVLIFSKGILDIDHVHNTMNNSIIGRHSHNPQCPFHHRLG